MNKEERLKRDGATAEPILFYDHREHDWGIFSNFSHHTVSLPNPFTGQMIRHLTGEHRFQAMKAVDTYDYDFVNSARNASEAKHRGREITLRDGWGSDYGTLCWYVMVELLMAKTAQHTDMEKALLKSKWHYLYEDSPTDDIWGWRKGPVYDGKNLLGKALMVVRSFIL